MSIKPQCSLPKVLPPDKCLPSASASGSSTGTVAVSGQTVKEVKQTETTTSGKVLSITAQIGPYIYKGSVCISPADSVVGTTVKRIVDTCGRVLATIGADGMLNFATPAMQNSAPPEEIEQFKQALASVLAETGERYPAPVQLQDAVVNVVKLKDAISKAENELKRILTDSYNLASELGTGAVVVFDTASATGSALVLNALTQLQGTAEQISKSQSQILQLLNELYEKMKQEEEMQKQKGTEQKPQGGGQGQPEQKPQVRLVCPQIEVVCAEGDKCAKGYTLWKTAEGSVCIKALNGTAEVQSDGTLKLTVAEGQKEAWVTVSPDFKGSGSGSNNTELKVAPDCSNRIVEQIKRALERCRKHHGWFPFPLPLPFFRMRQEQTEKQKGGVIEDYRKAVEDLRKALGI